MGPAKLYFRGSQHGIYRLEPFLGVIGLATRKAIARVASIYARKVVYTDTRHTLCSATANKQGMYCVVPLSSEQPGGSPTLGVPSFGS